LAGRRVDQAEAPRRVDLRPAQQAAAQPDGRGIEPHGRRALQHRLPGRAVAITERLRRRRQHRYRQADTRGEDQCAPTRRGPLLAGKGNHQSNSRELQTTAFNLGITSEPSVVLLRSVRNWLSYGDTRWSYAQ